MQGSRDCGFGLLRQKRPLHRKLQLLSCRVSVFRQQRLCQLTHLCYGSLQDAFRNHQRPTRRGSPDVPDEAGLATPDRLRPLSDSLVDSDRNPYASLRL